jgi:ABC-type sugar transport system ATPase subunit
MILKGKGRCCPDLSNSIYQRNGSAPGLTVKDGMLLNNRPDSITGIQEAAMTRKSMKMMEKTSIYADAMVQAKVRTEGFGY